MSVARQMNIKKGANIVDQINEVVNQWPQYAEQTNVSPKLRDAINGTLININQ